MHAFLKLIRFSNQFGSILLFIPCFLGLTYCNAITISNVIIFAICSFLGRSAGCIMNDIADKKIDQNTPTTSQRVLASGQLSVKSAIIFGAILLIISSYFLQFFSQKVWIFLAGISAVVVIYPFTKRFFFMPQLVLGIAYASGFVIAVIHGRNLDFFNLQKEEYMAYFALILWVIFYDTIYAKRDFSHDITNKTHSSAVFFVQKFWLSVCILLGFCSFLILKQSHFVLILTTSIFLLINLQESSENFYINTVLILIICTSNILLFQIFPSKITGIFCNFIIQGASLFMLPSRGFKLNSLCIAPLFFTFL